MIIWNKFACWIGWFVFYIVNFLTKSIYSLPFSLLLDFGDTCSGCTIDQIFNPRLNTKFDYGQHVNPLFTLLGSKLYIFSNYVWYYSKLKKKKNPLYHSYFFSHFPKLEIHSESSYLTTLTLSYSILQILSFYFKLFNEVFLIK